MYQISKFCSNLGYKELVLPYKVATINEAMYHISVYATKKGEEMSYFRIKDTETDEYVGGCFEGRDFKHDT